MTDQNDDAPKRISAAGLVAPKGRTAGAKVEIDTTPVVSEDGRIGGLTLSAWDERWTSVPDGFAEPQSKLRHKIGLFAATRGGQYFYIGRAANERGHGLAGGLARPRGKNASGDKGHGMARLSEHWHEFDAQVIALDRSPENPAIVKELYKAMLRRHDPIYNRPPAVVSAAIVAAKVKGRGP